MSIVLKEKKLKMFLYRKEAAFKGYNLKSIKIVQIYNKEKN